MFVYYHHIDVHLIHLNSPITNSRQRICCKLYPFVHKECGCSSCHKSFFSVCSVRFQENPILIVHRIEQSSPLSIPYEHIFHMKIYLVTFQDYRLYNLAYQKEPWTFAIQDFFIYTTSNFLRVSTPNISNY